MGRNWDGFVEEPVPSSIGRATIAEALEVHIEVPDVPDTDVGNIELISNSSAKTYMSVYAITDTASRQYEYISEEITIDARGFLQDAEGYYGVALGSYFGEIGSRYIFTLDTGIELPVVKVEEKSDAHTIDGYYHAEDGSVIEFVIDTETEYMKQNIHGNRLIFSGNFNNSPEFAGNIQKIEKISQKEK